MNKTKQQIVLDTFDEYEDTDRSTEWIIAMCKDRSKLDHSEVISVLTKNRFELVEK
jgi:hypothetical protein